MTRSILNTQYSTLNTAPPGNVASSNPPETPMRQLLILAALVTAAAFATAQGHGTAHRFRFAGSDGGSLVQLAERPEVQTELGLTNEEKAKLSALENGMQAQVTANFEAMQKSKTTDPNKMRGTISATGDKFARALPGILTKPQYKRLQELMLQKAGYGAVLRDDVKAQLHVTAAQKTKIAKAESDLLAGFDKIRANGMGKANPMAMVAARDKAVQNALTPAQQKQFEAMKGKPFKFATGM